MDNIVLIGSSGHAKVIIDVVEEEARYRIVGLLDSFRNVGEETSGYKVLGREEDLSKLARTHAVAGAIIAIGDNYVRSQVASRIAPMTPRISFVTAIHPRATIAKCVSIGEGTVIMSGVTVNPDCAIGRFCILNTNSAIDHETVMEDFSSIGPGGVTGGNCRLGDCSAVGIGAVLSHGLSIGAHSVIGAGSVVVHDIDSRKVAYGVPARAVRDRTIGEKYL